MAHQGKSASTLERGRDAYAARAWAEAHALLLRADETEPLAPPDLGLLATAAYMLGREEEWVAAHERAHHIHLESGDAEQAARADLAIVRHGDGGKQRFEQPGLAFPQFMAARPPVEAVKRRRVAGL